MIPHGLVRSCDKLIVLGPRKMRVVEAPNCVADVVACGWRTVLPVTERALHGSSCAW